MQHPGRRTIPTLLAAAAVAAWPGRRALGAGLGVRDVIAALRGPKPADLAGLDLSRLDLADLDFSGANLRGASLFGADLTGAKLMGASLSGANLDRSIIIRADFSDADLSGITMFLPAASSILGDNPVHEAPRFRRANLAGARLLAKLGNADWTGAVLEGARLELGRTQFLAALRSDLGGGRMVGAKLDGADLSGVRLAFADLRGARLVGANLEGADLAGARLDGADLTGARLARADLNGASLHGALGLDHPGALDGVRNLSRAAK